MIKRLLLLLAILITLPVCESITAQSMVYKGQTRVLTRRKREKVPKPPKPKRTYELKHLVLGGVSFINSENAPTSYGLTYACYKEFGGYVRAESNFLFPKVDKSRVPNKDAYWDDGAPTIFWKDNLLSARTSALTAGGVWNAHQNVMLLFGMGYQQSRFYGETISGEKLPYYFNSWWSSRDEYSDQKYAIYADVGVVFHIKAFSISVSTQLGAGPTDSYFGCSIGLGVNF